MNWEPVWGIQYSIEKTVEWYRKYLENGAVITMEQIDMYIDDAVSKGIIWK